MPFVISSSVRRRSVWTSLLGAMVWLTSSTECPAAPPYEIEQTPALRCVEKTTWFDSMLASRAALQADEAAGTSPTPNVSFHSDVVRGRHPARDISVPIDSVEEVYLYVTGAPDVEYGAGDWIAPRAIDANCQETLLCSGKYLEIQQGFHTVDCSLRSRVDPPLRIADQLFEHGINLQAPGKIRVKLPKGTVRFEAKIGIDDWVNPDTYLLPQPDYYQPHHYSTAALRERTSTADHPPSGAVRFHVTDAAGAARIDLWTRLAEDFSQQTPRQQMKWEREDCLLEADWTPGDWRTLALRYAQASGRVAGMRAEAHRAAEKIFDGDRDGDRSTFDCVRGIYHRSRQVDQAVSRSERLDFDAVRDALRDLIGTHGGKYTDGPAYLRRLAELESQLAAALRSYRETQNAERSVDRPDMELHARILDLLAAFDALRYEALTANPLLDWDQLLLVRRTPHGDPRRAMGRGYGVAEYLGYPRQSSKCNPGIEQPMNWENDICVLSPPAPNGQITTLYQPEGRRLLKDLDLDWDAQSILFSMPGSHDKWHVFEITTDGTTQRQVTPTDQDDIHFYDPCHLPSGEIAMVSTAPLQGVPCNTGVIVGMMFKMNADGTGIRQLAFEQDHTYNPTVAPDGRILYLRWDYTDTPHVWNRVLFTMNPDGTNQSEFYGTNSYWPNSLFHARPVPGHPTQFVGIVTGHHVGRAGEMILFDRAKGRREASGVVQRLGDRHGRVEPLIEDKLTQHSWPKFLHPYPLSDKYFLVSCKPTPDSLWGIYLVDVFDNLVLLKEEEGRALLEPIPLRSTPRPPVIPDQTEPDVDEGTVFLADIYAGPGLHGVPRGTVKQLRVFTYHFAYQKQAGINHRVGADGPWEIKQVLGTVPVAPDGSAFFRVPAKTPISLQPLDEDGKALQLMRSWMTVMPGETRSCIGCHEDMADGPPAAIQKTLAGLRRPVKISHWYGPPRGFSFAREVQPVLEKYCVSCHDGTTADDGTALCDLRAKQGVVWAYRHGSPDLVRCENTPLEELAKRYSGLFQPSYIELRKQIRVGGLESDLHLLPPMEFHADTSRLVQMLKNGHHGVQLNAEAWDRLITWIDLNAPCHGTWSEFTRIAGNQDQRRCELRAMYGGITGNGEEIIYGDPPFGGDLTPVVPQPDSKDSVGVPVDTSGAILEAAFGREMTTAASGEKEFLSIALGDDVSMRLVRIPAGPLGEEIAIDRPFWMGVYEVTNRQYAQIDPDHDSRFEHRGSWIFSEEYLGWPLDAPDQPVVRVSWNEAVDFCEQLSARTGRRIRLPSEREWEYACRSGTSTPFWFGVDDADYTPFANLADRSLRKLATDSWGPRPPDLAARDDRFDDGHLVTASVGSFESNPFGLYDMHGNAAEWTLGQYANKNDQRTVRGGSWRDLPRDSHATERFGYRPFQKVFNVGFRVVCEVDQPAGQRKVALDQGL
jgi:hypothetical protein